MARLEAVIFVRSKIPEVKSKFIFRQIPEKLKIENHRNDNWGEFLYFEEFTLYMIFEIFNENIPYRIDQFQENRENHKVGCVFPMVDVSILPHAEFGSNDHQVDAPHFIRRFRKNP